jgi:mono/diheme cytochrome c family protein
MRAWGTVLVAMALAAAAGCGAGGSHREPSASQLRAEGRQVFVAARCGSCHGLAAVGARGGFGPDFDTSERLDRAQIRAALLSGVGGMPSYARTLTPRQQEAVVEFLYGATHRARR